MADASPKDFSETPASNGTVKGVNIAEGMQAAQLNDAIRAVLAVVKNGNWGSAGILADAIAESTADAGVTIDGLLIKDGALPGITAAGLPGLVVASTGDYKETAYSTPDTGWLMANGDTLGSAGSAADQASDDNEALFLLLWDEFANAQLPVTGGRGANAAADWAANKIIALPNRNNRVPVGAGDTYANGETGGAATVTLTAAQSGLPNHEHDIPARVSAEGGSQDNSRLSAGNTGGSAFTFDGANVGGDDASEAHENMPPYLAVYYQIKL